MIIAIIKNKCHIIKQINNMGLKPTIKQVKLIFSDVSPNVRISTKTCRSFLRDIEWLILDLEDTNNIDDVIKLFDNDGLKQTIQDNFQVDPLNILDSKRNLLNIIMAHVFSQVLKYVKSIYVPADTLTDIAYRLLE